MRKRRKFSDEFKREAVRLATQSGVTKSQIGRELGINANLLSRWCRDLAANGSGAFPGQGKPRDEEMAALKRELARVKKGKSSAIIAFSRAACPVPISFRISVS
jgi:transposase